MGMRAWIAYCYRGTYYRIYKQWGELEHFGERLVKLLNKHSDPEEWRRLLDKAVFVQFTSKDGPPPSDDVLEGIRQFVLADEKLKLTWLKDMSRIDHYYGPECDNHLWPMMEEILQDPVKFRDFCRTEAEKKMGGGNGWAWLCRDIDVYEELFFRILELGVLVYSHKPKTRPPQLDLFKEYVYIVDIDRGNYFVSSCHVLKPGMCFKFGNIPKNWRRCLLVKPEWLDLAFAYTPAVKQLMKRKMSVEESGLIWSLVAEKIGYKEWMIFLELLQDFLFKPDSDEEPLLKALGLEHYHDEKAYKRKGIGPLKLLLDIYCIPSASFSSKYAVDHSCYVDLSRFMANPLSYIVGSSSSEEEEAA